uniref:Kinase n=1 Tax=Strigamia maritima TaxID=126957 RepID=T1JME0_STRMM
MTTYVVGSLPPPPEGTRYVLRQAGGHHEQNGDNLVIQVQFLKVEDITRRFQRPCILDIKLKADVHDPFSAHSSHPIYTFAQKYNFLIDGIQVYHKNTNRYVSFGKSFGRWLDEDGVERGLLTFLNADSGVNEFLICAFLERLEKIKTWANQQCHFSFYRSSLLLVYDAVDHPAFNRNEALAITDVRMVDFAKVYSSSETDCKYENAIGNFMQCLRKLLPCKK